jgi:hypothetical protein
MQSAKGFQKNSPVLEVLAFILLCFDAEGEISAENKTSTIIKCSERAKPEESGDAKPRVLHQGWPGCRNDSIVLSLAIMNSRSVHFRRALFFVSGEMGK